MTQIETIQSGNLSELVQAINANDEAVASLQRGGTQPAVFPEGALWDDSGAGQIKRSNGAGSDGVVDWSAGVATLFNADGSVALTGNLDAGGNRITNVAPSVNSTDVVTRAETVIRDGSQGMTGELRMNGQPITGVPAPTGPLQAANKEYVDGLASSLDVSAIVDRIAALAGGTALANNQRKAVFVTIQLSSVIGGSDIEMREDTGSAWRTVASGANQNDIVRAAFFVPVGGEYRVTNGSTIAAALEQRF